MAGHFEEFRFESQDLDHPLTARLFVPEKITSRTGLATVVHAWGANRVNYDHLPGFFENRDLFFLQVEHRDSGYESEMGKESGFGWNVPYEFGKRQAIDVLRAVHATLQRYDINRNRLFVAGGSGGGHNALQAAAFAPNTFALTVGMSPVTKPTSREDVEHGGYVKDAKPGRCAEAGYPFENGWGGEGMALGVDKHFSKEELAIRNCQRPEHVAAIKCRVILMHGFNEDLLDERHSIDMAQALARAGKSVELHIEDTAKHGGGFSKPLPGFGQAGYLERYAGQHFEELETDGKTDFERRETIHIGNWRVTYTSGIPEIIGPSK